MIGPSDGFLTSVPAMDDWEVPLTCFRCGGRFEVPFQFIKPGTVLHCPHCNGAFVPNTSMYQNISRRLTSFYEEWNERLAKLRKKQKSELNQFEGNLRTGLERLKEDIDNLKSDAELAGAPQRTRGIFG